MSDFETKSLENGKILVISPSDPKAIVPVFCPLCSFPMRTLEDSIAYRTHQTCAHCEMRWSGSNLGKWAEGWRPAVDTDGWTDYIIYRKALGRSLITLR